MATLVHDDVIDESTLRRGKETMQHRYGKTSLSTWEIISFVFALIYYQNVVL